MVEPCGGTLRFSGHWILTNVFVTQADQYVMVTFFHVVYVFGEKSCLTKQAPILGIALLNIFFHLFQRNRMLNQVIEQFLLV